MSKSSEIVIDAGIALNAVLPNPRTSGLEPFFNWHQQEARILVPSIWFAETTSTVRRYLFHRQITPRQGEQAVADLFALGVEEVRMDQRLCQSVLTWAEKLQQSKAYDAFYIALAEQQQAVFWTMDLRLARGAEQLGIDWVRTL